MNQSYQLKLMPPMLSQSLSTVERGEEVVETRRTDEILVKAYKLTGVSIGEAKVEINYAFRFDSDLRRNQSHNPFVVLAKDLALALQMFFQLILHGL